MLATDTYNLKASYKQYFIPFEQLESIFTDMMIKWTGIDPGIRLWFDDETYSVALNFDPNFEEWLSDNDKWEEFWDKMPEAMHPDEEFINMNVMTDELFGAETFGGIACNYGIEDGEEYWEVEVSVPV